jgi:PX domain
MEKNIDIDEETSPEVNRMSKLSFSIDYKQDVVGRQINIKEYVLKDEKFAKKIYFLVAGDDNQGSFEVSRRYKEFIYLRNTLIDSWPGFYVPKIPMKNYTVIYN